MSKEKEYGYECDGGIDRRNKVHCEMVIELNAKFQQFMERYERDRVGTSEFREKVEASLERLAEQVRAMAWPYRLLVGVVSIVGIAFMGEMIKSLWDFIRSRFH